MAVVRMNFQDMSEDTYADFKAKIEDHKKQGTEFDEFYGASVLTIDESFKDIGGLYVSLNFHIPLYKAIFREEMIEKLPDLSYALGFPWKVDCNTASEPVVTLSDDPMCMGMADLDKLNDTTEIQVYPMTVPKLTRVFFWNANPFEAMHAMAVIDGVTEKSSYFSSVEGMTQQDVPSGEKVYMALFEHQAGERLIEKIRKNHSNVSEMKQTGDEVDIVIDTQEILKKAELARRQLA